MSESSPENKLDEVERALQDPRIGKAIDYWGALPGDTGGHGIKHQKGEMPVNQTVKLASTTSLLTLQRSVAELRVLGDWHAGKGVVFKIREPQSTTYMTHYQIKGSSRPDIDSFIVFPNTADFDGLMADIDGNPALLAANIPNLFPEAPARIFPEQIEMVVPGVQDVTTRFEELQAE